MSFDQAYFYYIFQKIVFQMVHKTTIWLLLVFALTAGTAWHLGNLLDKHNAREREAKLAHNTALGYILSVLALWLFSFIMS